LPTFQLNFSVVDIFRAPFMQKLAEKILKEKDSSKTHEWGYERLLSISGWDLYSSYVRHQEGRERQTFFGWNNDLSLCV